MWLSLFFRFLKPPSLTNLFFIYRKRIHTSYWFHVGCSVLNMQCLSLRWLFPIVIFYWTIMLYVGVCIYKYGIYRKSSNVRIACSFLHYVLLCDHYIHFHYFDSLQRLKKCIFRQIICIRVKWSHANYSADNALSTYN